MKGLILSFILIFPSISMADEALRTNLEKTYAVWRDSLIKKDVRIWQQVTAAHRQVEVKNRIISEKLPFPASVFNLPAPPPLLNGLKFLTASEKGPTAKAAYFGKIDFGVGGEPSDNLLVLSFIKSGNRYLYDKADFVNLTALPDVREELAAGDMTYLKGVPEAQPSGHCARHTCCRSASDDDCQGLRVLSGQGGRGLGEQGKPPQIHQRQGS